MGKPKPGSVEDIADPAKGAAVPRCRACGMPDTATSHLLEGTWHFGAFAMRLILCERELPPLDPRMGDPLTVA